MDTSELNQDGLVIPVRDLTTLSPTSDDDGRLYNHNGASAINLADGGTTSNPGYYMWDSGAGVWNPMKATVADADLLDGLDSTEFLQDLENAVSELNLDFDPAKQSDLHTRYDDTEAVYAVNNDPDHGSTAAHNYYTGPEAVTAVNNETSLTVDITGDADTVDGNHASAFLLESNKYTDSEAVAAVNAETGLSVDISGDADTVDGYDIQKDGTDGTGVINFKTT